MPILFTLSVIGIAVLLAVAAALPCFCLAGHIQRRHYWKAQHLREIGCQIGVVSLWGIALSFFFSFNGEKTGYSLLSCALFMTFLYPFLSLDWISDWPGSKWFDRMTTTGYLCGIASFAMSMVMLGAAAWAACMNSAHPEYALLWGFAVGGTTTFGLLLAAAGY